MFNNDFTTSAFVKSKYIHFVIFFRNKVTKQFSGQSTYISPQDAHLLTHKNTYFSILLYFFYLQTKLVDRN